MKTKTILFGLTIISLFLVSTSVKAGTYFNMIYYPETIDLGEIIEIEVTFNYQEDWDCLYGDYVYLFYSINKLTVPHNLDGDNIIYREISSNNPRPALVTFTTNTAYMSALRTMLEAGDSFKFKIMFEAGNEFPDGSIYRVINGLTYSGIYTIEITTDVTSTTDTVTDTDDLTGPLNVSFVSIFVSFMIFSLLILIVRKTKTKQKKVI